MFMHHQYGDDQRCIMCGYDSPPWIEAFPSCPGVAPTSAPNLRRERRYLAARHLDIGAGVLMKDLNDPEIVEANKHIAAAMRILLNVVDNAHIEQAKNMLRRVIYREQYKP